MAIASMTSGKRKDPRFKEDEMDELYLTYVEEFERGETKESFENWYSSRCADAYDRAKAQRQDAGVP